MAYFMWNLNDLKVKAGTRELVIDVSDNQAHPIDWGKVKEAGIKGAIIKLSQGDGYTNEDAAEDIAGAMAVGIRVAGYHYGVPPLDVNADADHAKLILEHYNKQFGIEMQGWLDYEDNSARLDWQQLTAWAESWMNRNKDFGIELEGSWIGAMRGVPPFGHKLWLMQWTTGTPTYASTLWEIGQCDVPGINDPVDVSIFTGVATLFETEFVIAANLPKAPQPPAAPGITTVAIPLPILTEGLSMASVEAAQVLVGGIREDGQFGPVTTAAVKAYQGKHGLADDGVVGESTWRSLLGVDA